MTSESLALNEYIVEGSTNLDDLNDELGLQMESDDYDSLGGFIIEKARSTPFRRRRSYNIGRGPLV